MIKIKRPTHLSCDIKRLSVGNEIQMWGTEHVNESYNGTIGIVTKVYSDFIYIKITESSYGDIGTELSFSIDSDKWSFIKMNADWDD